MAKKRYYVYKSVAKGHLGHSYGHRMPLGEPEYFGNKKDAERKLKECRKNDNDIKALYWIDFEWEGENAGI